MDTSIDTSVDTEKYMNGLIRIIYSSELRIVKLVDGKFVPDTEDVDGIKLIETIRQKAEVFNKANAISGVLLYNRTTHELIQVLEGSVDAVLNLYMGHIEKDPRHRNIKLRLEMKVKDRQFKDWGMLAGEQKHWKVVKTILPPSVESKTIASFDEALKVHAAIEHESKEDEGEEGRGALPRRSRSSSLNLLRTCFGN